MFKFSADAINQVLATYGYLAVLILVGIESIGIPVPGETMLVAASIYAGTTHHLRIALVILAASVGAIIGDNIGFWVGDIGGYRLLRRYGHYIGIDEGKLKLGRYLFAKHGGKVVFFGRFIAVLRALAAFLAGTNRMPWPQFLAANAAGGIVWATIFGLGGYLLGDNIHRIEGTLRYVAIAVGIAITVAAVVLIRRNEARLEAEAERAYPGPLDDNPGVAA